MRWTVHRGVYFFEGTPELFERIGPIDTQLKGWLASNQLQNLGDLKEAMAAKAAAEAANCIADFKYVQRSASLLVSLFNRDDIFWYGSGVVGRVPPEAVKLGGDR